MEIIIPKNENLPKEMVESTAMAHFQWSKNTNKNAQLCNGADVHFHCTKTETLSFVPWQFPFLAYP